MQLKTHWLLPLWLALALSAPLRADTVLVFNEIMYHPATNEPALEWVELHNQMAVDVDISGWSLGGAIQYAFPSNTVVPGRGFIVVAVSPSALMAQTGLPAVYGPFTGRLGNNGDHLELRNNSGWVMDRVDYGMGGDWPVAPDGSGASLAKLDRDAASAPAQNWIFSAQAGGTPGADNFPLDDGNGPPAPTVAFNEYSSPSNTVFWLELINGGTNDYLLDGHVVLCDGPTNLDYTFPSNNLRLGPGQFLVLTDSQLGFHPAAGNRLYFYSPLRDQVLDSVALKTTARARRPDGVGPWLRPSVETAGASNVFALRDEIVINEILYRHALIDSTNGLPPQPSAEAWIELYNRSSNVVDLTGWELGGGIRYQFSPGKTLAPGGYLVVAEYAAALRSLYPAMDVVGDLAGRLSGRSDLILLMDATGNPADEVRYFDGGRWPEYANGGGSSLELRDAGADNSKAEAWAASDETAKASWQTYTYRMVAAIPAGSGQPTQWNDFILGLLDAGECLIDDLSVVDVSGADGADVDQRHLRERPLRLAGHRHPRAKPGRNRPGQPRQPRPAPGGFRAAGTHAQSPRNHALQRSVRDQRP